MAEDHAVAAGSRGHRRLRRLRTWIVAALALLVVGVAGCNGYLLAYERIGPSGEVYLANPSGERVELVSSRKPAVPTAPTPVDAAPTGLLSTPRPKRSAAASHPRRSGSVGAIAKRSAGGTEGPPARTRSTRSSAPGALRPPVRLRIPRIDVDAVVVPGNNDNLPKFPGIGWYLGTAYPGAEGNVVMFGHLDGPYATLGRLRQLERGDGVYVGTRKQTYSYTVRGSRVVDRFDTAVMAPSTDARLTLITCIGTWLPDAGTYDRRLVVDAELSGRRDGPLPGTSGGVTR